MWAALCAGQITTGTHSSTSGTAPNPDGLWESGNLAPGQTFSHTFNTVGTFQYFCRLHTFMVATINVVASCLPTSTPIATSTATFTPTPTSTAAASLLVGHVTWQGPLAQPNVRQQLPITPTLRLGSNPEADYPGLTTDSSGFFTVTVTGLPSGTYTWRAKGPKYLATCGTVDLLGAPTTQAEMGLEKAGDSDASHNNIVNTVDFTTLKGVFGQGSPVGDFNNDGVTNTIDFTLLKGNFGQAGCGPVLR